MGTRWYSRDIRLEREGEELTDDSVAAAGWEGEEL